MRVRTTSHFDRQSRKLAAKHSEIPGVVAMAVQTLASDPYRSPGVRKLSDVGPEEGNFRLRIGPWRIRYSIHREVVLYSIALRREDTY